VGRLQSQTYINPSFEANGQKLDDNTVHDSAFGIKVTTEDSNLVLINPFIEGNGLGDSGNSSVGVWMVNPSSLIIQGGTIATHKHLVKIDGMNVDGTIDINGTLMLHNTVSVPSLAGGLYLDNCTDGYAKIISTRSGVSDALLVVKANGTTTYVEGNLITGSRFPRTEKVVPQITWTE